jgi:broad specificity phosphatase PhoE
VSAVEAPGAWALSEDGVAEARRLGRLVRSVGVTTVVSSTERKAVATAEALGLGAVRTDERLCEVVRPWYEDEGSFRVAVHGFLSGDLTFGGESCAEAGARFDSAVVDLVGGAVVVSHGTVMSAWLRLRIPGFDPVGFWEQLRMPDAWLVDLSARSVTRMAS